MKKYVALPLVLLAVAYLAGCFNPYAKQPAKSYNSLMSPDPNPQYEERVVFDEFTGETRYQYYPGRKMFETRMRATCVKDKKGKKTLTTEVYYYGRNWLFVNSLFLKVDNEDPVRLGIGGFSRDVISGDLISEKAFGTINLAILKKIAASNKATLRFYGDNGTKDYIISVAEKQGLAWVISRYEE